MAGQVLTIACAQTGARSGAGISDQALQETADLISAAADQGAQIVIFPELFLTPFFPNKLNRDVSDYFMTISDSRLLSLCDACRSSGISAIIPIAEAVGPAYYNSAIYVDSKGRVVGTYRKTHMPAYFPTDQPGGTGSFERMYFAPGEELPVFDQKGVPFGIQICNDRLYPEGSRVLALKGAKMLFMPISYSVYDQPQQRRENWDAILRARAIENGVFVIACNRAGKEGPRHHLGRSMIIAPGGKVLRTASETSDELMICDLNLDELEDARFSMPWWRDRRSSLYQSLSASCSSDM